MISRPDDTKTIISERDLERHPEISQIAKAIAEEKLAKGSKMRLPLPITEMANCHTLHELIDQCGETAKGHGFWEAHVDTALQILGIARLHYDAFVKVAILDDRDATATDKELHDPLSSELRAQCRAVWRLAGGELVGDPSIFLALISTEAGEAMEAARNGNWNKPSGVWEELADVAIRLFDFVARYGPKHEMPAVKFIQTIQAKMAVNESRPPKHGKAY